MQMGYEEIVIFDEYLVDHCWTGHSNYQIEQIGPNQRYPLSNLDTLPAVTPLYKVDVQQILDNTNTEYTSAELTEHCYPVPYN